MTKELVLGNTRTSLGLRHALIGPDSHVPSVLPGIENATTVILISPALGAGFTQFLVLEDAWYPVAAGDCIWMAPYCPQWFVAMGKSPARYLYYKDINRATY